MSPASGGRIFAGLIMALIALSLFDNPTYAFQGRATTTPFARRSLATLQPFATSEVLATLTLAEPAVKQVVADARSAGLTDLQILARASSQWLRISAAQAQLVQILTQAPYNAVVLDQAYWEQDSLTIRVQATHLGAIQALPGVLSLSFSSLSGLPSGGVPPPQDVSPSTIEPPPRPPGYNS